MAIDGRWCCRTIVGPSDVARVMQLLEDDERLRVVARRLDVSPSVHSADYGEVTRILESTPGTGSMPFLKTRPFSYILVGCLSLKKRPECSFLQESTKIGTDDL